MIFGLRKKNALTVLNICVLYLATFVMGNIDEVEKILVYKVMIVSISNGNKKREYGFLESAPVLLFHFPFPVYRIIQLDRVVWGLCTYMEKALIR